MKKVLVVVLGSLSSVYGLLLKQAGVEDVTFCSYAEALERFLDLEPDLTLVSGSSEARENADQTAFRDLKNAANAEQRVLHCSFERKAFGEDSLRLPITTEDLKQFL